MKLYTTSEYVESLEPLKDGNIIICKKKEFIFFSNKKAADYDAQWLVDHYKKEGKKVKKPVVYKVKLERVKK